MTLWPAYQHFEEKTKGSIEVGQARRPRDPRQNPLTVDRAKITTSRSLETIKEGRSVYTAPRAEVIHSMNRP